MYSIAIIGAGPAGATLARLLLQLPSHISSRFSITIFERDASRKSRFHQGGTLDLHPQTGLAALKKANLWDEFMKYARYDGEELRLGDRNGTVYVHITEAPQIEGFDARPEIDREALKDVLLDSLPEGMVCWGRNLRHVNAASRALNFLDPEGNEIQEGPFDLIVGADGAWSKVRNVLTEVKPNYSGICSIGAKITAESAGKHWDDISKMVGKGSNFSYSYNKCITGQRMGDGSLTVAFAKRADPEWGAQLKKESGGDERKFAKLVQEEFSDWHSSFQQWLHSVFKLNPWPLYELPVGHRWDHREHFTMIGDAAHLMTPYAGEGVNAAMKSALDLAEAIERSFENNENVDKNIATFEESMFERAKVFMARTLRNKNTMFAEDAPYGFLATMIEIAAHETGHDLGKGFLSYLPIKKAVYAAFWLRGTFGASVRHIGDFLASRM